MMSSRKVTGQGSVARTRRSLRRIVAVLLLIMVVAVEAPAAPTIPFRSNPGPYAPLGEWGYYQLWFLGKRAESVAEFIHLLVSGDLPSEGFASWLSWVGQDGAQSKVLLAQLQQLSTAERVDLRSQVGQVVRSIIYASPHMRLAATDLLTQMICRESETQLRIGLLPSTTHQNYFTRSQERVVTACLAATGRIDDDIALKLTAFNQVDPEIVRDICQIWRAREQTYGLANKQLLAWCLTEEEAVRRILTIFEQGSVYPQNVFDAVAATLNADGRFNDAMLTALLDRWLDGPSQLESFVAWRLSQLAEAASTQVVDRLAHVLMKQPAWSVMASLARLPFSPATRAEVMNFLRTAVEAPQMHMQHRADAAYYYGLLALDMDRPTQAAALELNLSIWHDGSFADLIDGRGFTLINQLAAKVGSDATQRLIRFSLMIVHHPSYAAHTRAVVAQNLPALLAADDATMVKHVVASMLNILTRSESAALHAGAIQVLASLSHSLTEDQQLQTVEAALTGYYEAERTGPCGTFLDSIEVLGIVGAADGLSATARRLVAIGLLHALSKSAGRLECSNIYTPIRALVGISRLLDEDTARIVADGAQKVADRLTRRDTNATRAIVARIEAAQVLNGTWSTDSLSSRLRYTPSESERIANGAALFLIAWCQPAERARLHDTLAELRSTASWPTVNAIGQTITMIEAIDLAIASARKPLAPLDYIDVTDAFEVAARAVGSAQYTAPFC